MMLMQPGKSVYEFFIAENFVNLANIAERL